MPKSDRFVGRQAELDRLEAALKEAVAGHGRVLLVAGEAGSGKTSLLRGFLGVAEPKYESVVTAWGDCSDIQSSSDPYLPFREVLSLLTGDVEDIPDEKSISKENRGRLRNALARSGQILVDVAPDLINVLVPGSRVVALMGKAVASRVGWLEKLDGLSRKAADASAVGAPALTQEHIFEEYTAFLGQLSEVNPLVIVLDDLQWADTASTGLLFHLARRLADRKILLLGAYRPDDLIKEVDGSHHPLETVINELKRADGDVVIDLATASGATSESFVNALIDAEPNHLDANFRHEMVERTEGHPLFVAELLRVFRERGDLYQDQDGAWVARPELDWSAAPPRVEGVIEQRLSRLDDPTLNLLRAASVEGDVFTAEVAADVLSQEPRQVVAALTELLGPRRGLLDSAGTRSVASGRVSQYRFHHHLVREHIYQAIDPAQRAYLHEDIAASLVKRFADELDNNVGPLAWHYRQAGLLEQAAHYGQLAGDRAYRMNAYQDALAQYAEVASLIDKVSLDSAQLVDLYQHWGRALELTGQRKEALLRYEELQALSDVRNDERMRLAALAAQVVILAVPSSMHNPEKAKAVAAQALELAGRLGDGAMEAKLRWSLSLIDVFDGRSEEAIQSGEQALALARPLELRELMAYILNDLIEPYAASGHIEKATRAGEEAIELWRSLDNPPMLASAIARHARTSLYSGDLLTAETLAKEALDIGKKIRNHDATAFSLTILGLSLFERGELSQALESLLEATKVGEEGGEALPITGIRAEAAWILAYLGRNEEAINLAEKAVATAKDIYPPALPWTQAILARILILGGATVDALSAQGVPPIVLTDQILNHSSSFLTLNVGCAAAESAFAGGDLDQAKKAAADWIGILEGRKAKLYLPDGWTLQGHIYRAREEWVQAGATLKSAADLATTLGLHRAAWVPLADLAALEAASGAEDASRGYFKEARSALDHLLEGIHDDAQRQTFAARPDVRAVLEATGPDVTGKA